MTLSRESFVADEVNHGMSQYMESGNEKLIQRLTAFSAIGQIRTLMLIREMILGTTEELPIILMKAIESLYTRP